MVISLHVAKVWQTDYEQSQMIGCDAQDAFYIILRMFGVNNSADDIYTDDFEIERSGLQRLKRHIVEQDEIFRQNAERFHARLKKIGMSREEFITVLDSLIDDSDQSDAYVHVSWY